MDAFDSETITGDSSTSEGDTIPPKQEQCPASTRKTRRTEDLISADISKSLQDSNQPIKRQRQDISFLPKIELSDDVGAHSVPKHQTLKQKRPSLAKNTAIFKIGRSMIEGKQFQGTRKANTCISKFPKIKLKLTSKGKSKGMSKISQKISKKPRTSDELTQVLSDAAEEFLSESEIKLRKAVKGFSRKSGQKNNNESSRMIFNELYVNLVPLEKTNLLNEEQRLQLKPKRVRTECLVLFNKRNSNSNRTKTSVGKKNQHKGEMEEDAQLSMNQPGTSAGRTRKSLHNINYSCLENIFPCKVVLERLSDEQIRVLTSLKSESDELIDENTSANDALSSIEINSSRISGSIPSMMSIESSHRISSMDASREKSNKSLKNCEESLFSPEGSLSPFISPQKLDNSKNTPPLSSSMRRRLAFEVDNVQGIESLHRISSMEASREKSNKSLKNCEESLFSPEGSLSPFISPQKLDDSKNTPPLSSSMKRRLAFEVDNVQGIESSHRISSMEASREKSNESPKKCEESFFSPKGSSSPFVSLQKLHDSKNTPPLSSSMKRRSTFEVDNVQGIHADRTTSSIKSQRISKSTSKNDTYELNKSSVAVPGNNKDATFEIDVPTVSTTIPLVKLSNSYVDGKGKRKRSRSCDSVWTDFPVNCLSEKEQQFEEQGNTSLPSILKKRRSTLTLEDSVNDISLLKSICDISGTPQQLNKRGKAKSQSLINQVLDNRSMSNQLDYSNITTRKHWSSHSESMRNGASYCESSPHLDSASGTWDSSSSSSNDDFELTDGVNVLPSSFVETIQCIDDEREESSEEEEEEMCNANSLADIIELSDEEPSSDSYDGEQLQKQVCRVTFETDSAIRETLNLPKVLLTRVNTPKSVIKSGTTSANAMKNRRVTFSRMSVIIVDDSSTSDGSPESKSYSALVPTNFPSDNDDDDDSSEEATAFKNRSKSIQKGVESPTSSKENETQSEGCFQSPHCSGKGRVGRTPIEFQTKRNSTPQFNKRGTVGRTPLRLKIPAEDNTLPKISKRLSTGDRARLQNETIASPLIKKTKSSTASKRTKMPDFANVHKRMYDKMLNLQEYSKNKDERAKLLLSGHKPGSSLKKSANKESESNSKKKTSTKKQLNYGEASTSAASKPRPELPKKTVLASSTPKSKKNEKTGYTRYGFKVVDNCPVTKNEQFMAVANKKRLLKSNTAENRTEIKGVRSNRRFDLLMKMRQKSQK